MNFYTDCNISGMNETKLTQILFRKNFELAKAKALRPPSIKIQEEIADMALLMQEHPEFFSGLS